MLLVNEDLHILFLSDTVEGKRHDKAIADSTPYPLPPGSALLQDLGLLGFSLEGVGAVMPVKKPRGGELSAEQKDLNRQVSQRRAPSSMSIAASNAAGSSKKSSGCSKTASAIS